MEIGGIFQCWSSTVTASYKSVVSVTKAEAPNAGCYIFQSWLSGGGWPSPSVLDRNARLKQLSSRETETSSRREWRHGLS